MQYSSEPSSSSCVPMQTAALRYASPPRPLAGPFTMGDESPEPHPGTMMSSVGFTTAPSAFASGFYGRDGAAHPFERAASTRRSGSRGVGDCQSSSSAAHLYGLAASTGAGGFSRISLYGNPSNFHDALLDNTSVAVACFTVPQFGAVQRSASTATSGTALSDCHLSRKDDGGFTPASAHTFAKSNDSFGDPSETSRPSLHDSLVMPAASTSALVRDSLGSAYYGGSSHCGSERDISRLRHSADSVSQRRLSHSIPPNAVGVAGALRVSGEGYVSAAAQRAGVLGSGTVSPQSLRTPRPHNRSDVSSSLNGRLGAPQRTHSATEEVLRSAASGACACATAWGSVHSGRGAIGCSPLYDLGTAFRDGSDATVVSSEEASGSPLHGAAVSARAATPTDRRRAVRLGRHVDESPRQGSITFSRTTQPPLLPKSLCATSVESTGALSGEGAPESSSPRKPRRKDPRMASRARAASIATASTRTTAAGGPATAEQAASSGGATPRAQRETPARSRSNDGASTGASPHASAARGATCGNTTVSSPATPTSAAQSLPHSPTQRLGGASLTVGAASSSSGVAPPPRRDRQSHVFQRRRYLEGQVTPLSAAEVQVTALASSATRSDGRGRRTAALSGFAEMCAVTAHVPAPPLSLRNEPAHLSFTAQTWSPSAPASSCASSSATPDKVTAVATAVATRRHPQRLTAFAGLHPSLGVDGLYGGTAAADSSNEKSTRSLGGRSGAESRLLADSSTGLASRSCPSVEYSVDEGTNLLLTRRSSSWSVHSARSTADCGEASAAAARKKRQAERMLPSVHELDGE